MVRIDGNPQGRNLVAQNGHSSDCTNSCGQLNLQAGITEARELTKHGQGAVLYNDI
jgi:hypothetical protein